MKKLLLILMLAFSLGTSAEVKPQESIHLEEGNFFAITSQFDQYLLDNFTEKLLNYDKKEMIIYFDTPGGSVLALSRMARFMKGSDVKFTCVANFAASAGFMLFQHCDNRLLLSDGVLMSHQWSGGFRGEAPRILTMFNTIQSLVDTLESTVINKMSVNADEYAALINKNLWMTSELATKYNAIDGITDKISCSKELVDRKILLGYTRGGFFGPPKSVYKSACPLIQKVYFKAKDSKKDVYVSSSEETLFKRAQKSYKLEQANWIYKGSKLK